jgi:SAM-dependent methyltransferase
MQTLEQQVAEHYTHGGLEQAILAGLRALGRGANDIRPEDLAAIDEFHVGGHSATEDLSYQLGLKPGTTLLDLGSGLGGPARFFARQDGCQVTGVDLTPEYVSVAARLTELIGLQDRAEFRAAVRLNYPSTAAALIEPPCCM